VAGLLNCEPLILGPVFFSVTSVSSLAKNQVPAAGELGSSFGHLYLSGGNIAECLVTGRVAGRNAASLAP